MTDRIEILAQQGAKLSVTLNLSAGGSILGRALRMQVRKFPGDTVVQLVASSTDERLLATGERRMQLEVDSATMALLLVNEPVELWSYDAYSFTDADDSVREAEGQFRISRAVTRDTELEPAPTVSGFVSATIPQAWTADQQQQARLNIGIGETPSGPETPSDHGALEGLADDDHPQYHNNARGDARYAAIGHNHDGQYEEIGQSAFAVAAHEAASDPHPNYTTAAEAAAAAPVQSVAGRTGAVTLSTSDVSGLGTAATHNVPASGNASSGEVVKGSDTRLDVAATTTAATSKTTPVDADQLPLVDSAASNILKKLTWANLKATAKAYFDTLYAALTHTHALSDLTASGATSGQVPTWNGSAWVPATPSGASPGGSGSELQYRSGSTTFGAVAGSHYDAANGRVSLGAGTSPAAVGHFACDSASEIVAILQAASSQTANIFENRNSAGTLLSAFTKNGNLRIGSGFLNSGGSQLVIGDTDGGTTSGDLTCATFRGSRYRDDTNHAALGELSGIAGLLMKSANAVAWSSDTTWYGTVDLQLKRAAASVLAILNGSTGGAAMEFTAMTAPSAPSAGKGRAWFEDNGSGKMRYMVQFPTGAAQQISIEP